MARVAEDVVVLDALAGQYHCLVDLGAVLDPAPEGSLAEPPADLAAALFQAGLTSREPAPHRRVITAPSQEAQADATGSWRTSRGAAASLVASSLSFRRQSFASLLAPPRLRRVAEEDQLAATLGAAEHALTWIPGEGACLQRAYQMRRLLASRGHKTIWVFGVRTWPFAAHCWLQANDQVIADRLERIRRYTPIMAV